MKPLHITHFVVLTLLMGNVSSPALSQSNSDCLMCHGEPSFSAEKKGKTVSLFVDEKKHKASAHSEMECVACHEGFKPDQIPHASKPGRVDCLSCHESEEFAGFTQSVHGKKGDCSGCHTNHEIKKVTGESALNRKRLADGICRQCHGEIEARFRKSDHGKALAAGVALAPGCVDCHGKHGVFSSNDHAAKTHRRNEASLCLSCHLDNPDVRATMGPSTGFISSYEKSVHGLAIQNNNEAAATCSDCHGSHEMKKGSNPESRVARGNIAETCGRCHVAIEKEYTESIHGQAMANGVGASATCTDCHGEHNILSPMDPSAQVSPLNVSAKVCSPCHSSVRLAEKYGLAADRFKSFEDSYHGLAGRAGSVEVANCASCHGVHDIKPSSDSTSRISPQNLAATCGSCHPGANVNFTKGAVHVNVDAAGGKGDILSLVATGYVILIVVVVGGMFIHNVLDFLKKSRRKLLQRRGMMPRHQAGHRLYLRMSLGERIQHGMLLVSFTILVLTGFALKFPDAWWVGPVRSLSPMIFELRGILHRIAAVVMVLAGLYHIYYVVAVPRGKQLLQDLMPVRQDITDAIHVLKYNLGFSRVKPSFGRFSYIEKSEYWALVWGTIVMAVTGVILWFDNTFLGLLTKLWWDVARAVHYYEAWLATLAIIVWHLYFVVFNPDTYPINLAFWKGTLTEEEMEDEHPVELENIKRQERFQGEHEKGSLTGRAKQESIL